MTTRWLRFALYTFIVGGALTVQADPIRRSLRLLVSRSYFAPDVPCIPCAVGLLVVLGAYLVWLAGGTVLGWRMPLFSHLVPIGLAFFTAWKGPLRATESADSTLAPADRAIAAMRALDAEAARTRRTPCELSASEFESVLNGRVPPSGFRSYGRASGYRVQVHPERGAALTDVQPDDSPGTLHVACSTKGEYYFTAVVADRLPSGAPAMVRDGVGRVVVISGEVTR